MNEETTQAFDKIADKIIQKVTQDFTEKLEIVRSELTLKIQEVKEQNEKLNEKMDTGFEIMHTQVNAVEENLTFRIQRVEDRMDKEADNRVTHYVTKAEHERLVERVETIEIILKPA